MNAPEEFRNLFKAGKAAARRGNHIQAHALFRQAIELDPYHEQVWLWLATVVDTDDDQRVCFENVLELNPGNLTARRQLQFLDNKALAEGANKPRQAHFKQILGLILIVVLMAVLATFVVLGLSLL